jgi:hypothetical protein
VFVKRSTNTTRKLVAITVTQQIEKNKCVYGGVGVGVWMAQFLLLVLPTTLHEWINQSQLLQ